MSRGVYEHPAGSGVFWILYYDAHGRRHREKVGPKGLATRVYQKRKTEIAEARFFPERVIRQRQVPLADFLRDFVRDHVVGKLKNADHEARYAQLWSAALGNHTVRSLSVDDVARYVTRRQETVCAASINRELAFLRKAMNHAIHTKLADTNPVGARNGGVKLAREHNARVRWLDDPEEARLHEAVGDGWWSVVAFALHSGFRQADQFHLPWTDVDFHVGTVTARRPKGGRAYTVPMNDTLRTLLAALPSRMRSPWVFPSRTGRTPLNPDNFMHRVFVPALKKARIDNFTWHDLRHTFASRLVMAGVPLLTVSKLMGHASLQMTERYAHLSPAHQREAVRHLDARRTATRTAISISAPAVAGRGGAIPSPAHGLTSGGGPDRTADLGIMRPSL